MFIGAIVDLIFTPDDSSAILSVLVGSILVSVRCGSGICIVRSAMMTAVAVLAFVLAVVRAGTKFGLLFGTATAHPACEWKLRTQLVFERTYLRCDVWINVC